MEVEEQPNLKRADALETATKVWTGQLVDLTGRNNLLYYKDLKVGTLDLETVPAEKLLSVLAGKTVALSSLFDAERASDVAKRARALRNKSQEHFEERGLETLFLACGMATWTNQRTQAVPAAPVFLVPARLAPLGAAQDDFELAVTGEAEVNPTLLHMLATEYQCEVDPESLLATAGIEGAVDTPQELEIAYQWLGDMADKVPGFAVDTRFVLGTFSYAKLPMVRDLEGALDAMVGHDLIAALAGDVQARAAVRERRVNVDPKQPDRTPPKDEFLVLDADASQNYAINAVLAGQDLVIKGPPGTGKSQTIANLISTLIARGQRVLFVAEKRAAIDAVLRRLEDVGLEDLVLDLHSGAGSRKAVASSLAKAMGRNQVLPRPNLDAEHTTLVTRRDELNGYTEALHGPRTPWNRSLFAAQLQLLNIEPSVRTAVRWRETALTQLDEPTFHATREHLRAFSNLGGLTLERSGSPWANATLVSSMETQAAHGLVERIRRHTLPTALGRLTKAAEETGLRNAETVDGWAEHLALWKDIAETTTIFTPDVFAEPLSDVLTTLAPLSAGAGSRVKAAVTSGEYRKTRKHILGLVQQGTEIDRASVVNRLSAASDETERWQRLASDGKLPGVPEDLVGAVGAYEQLNNELRELAERLGVVRLIGSPDDLYARLDVLLADTLTLSRLPELHKHRAALTNVGLSELCTELGNRGFDTDQCLDAFEYAWLASIVEHVKLVDTHLTSFDGEAHSRTVAEYKNADREHVETTAQRVRRLAAEHAARVQDAEPDQAALVMDQANRKRKHLPVRQLFEAAPELMTALKPCWAMSPLVVSQLLPSNKRYFDVVVFDEASQVRPADAIPAILRAERVVVAGDERQLPPTAFFTTPASDDDALDYDATVSLDSGFESILDGLLPFIDFRMLQWHYRSRDERLIAFSNVHLYDRGLTTFPGVVGDESLKHVRVELNEADLDAGVSSPSEVRAVVNLILQHAAEHRQESLGVIAMGIRHADRIEEELRRELRDHPDLSDFFDERRTEKFFVKNLERVQGDERDAIILSVGYGKNADARLRYQFGPLNQEGGERRLNVAITRAKNRMTVVSSFSAEDMDPDRTTRKGVDLLRLYLAYAESGGTNLGPRAETIPELNPFEVDVRDQLQRAGIPLIAQYGASGYRIDFVAKHPIKPGRMVLAIECDGASYHSSPTARDRDRLRQEQLERLGWKFHRIWSQEWFRNSEGQVTKARAAYDAAVQLADAPDPEVPDSPLSRPRGNRTPTPARTPRPNVLFGQPITKYTQDDLRSIVRWIESDTLVRTESKLIADVMYELGFHRRGPRIVAEMTQAIRAERGAQTAAT